jgi:hypothetical protein
VRECESLSECRLAPFGSFNGLRVARQSETTSLRISDVATIRGDAFLWDDEKQTWRVLLRTQKTGDAVYLPIPADLKLVLEAVPLPRNAAQDCPYYFWNGQTSRRRGPSQRCLRNPA